MCIQNCQQDSDQILPGICKALREAGKDLFPKFPLVFVACPLKSNMMEQAQSLRNNKIMAACIGESADINRKLATGTTEFRLFSLIFGIFQSYQSKLYQTKNFNKEKQTENF